MPWAAKRESSKKRVLGSGIEEEVEAFAGGEALFCVLGLCCFGAASGVDFCFLGSDGFEEDGHFLRVGAGAGLVGVELRG
jgi:hypothetical protein